MTDSNRHLRERSPSGDVDVYLFFLVLTAWPDLTHPLSPQSDFESPQELFQPDDAPAGKPGRKKNPK